MGKFKTYWTNNNYKKNKTQSKMCFRSKWEISFANYLDSNDRVVEWKQDFAFKYLDAFVTKKIKTYYIDFKVKFKSGSIIFFEVKPIKSLQERVKTKSIKYKLIHKRNYLLNISKFDSVNSFCKRSKSEFILVEQSRDKKFNFYRWNSKNHTVSKI